MFFSGLPTYLSMITLGHFYVCYAYSALSRYILAPREEHLQAAIYLIGYLNKTKDGQIVVDVGDAPVHEKAIFATEASWTEFYEDTEEAMPHHDGEQGE